MQKLETGMRVERGFTLIELLIVVLIIGITSSIAVLAFGDFGASRSVMMAAEQFSSYVKLVQQKAILETNTLGIYVAKDGYDTYRLENGINWRLMPASGFFRKHFFPKNMVAILKNTNNLAANGPNIIVNAAGDLSDFSLILGTSTQANLYTVIGKQNGELLIKSQQENDSNH